MTLPERKRPSRPLGKVKGNGKKATQTAATEEAAPTEGKRKRKKT